MKNKKLVQLGVAGVVGAMVLTAGIFVNAAEFSDTASTQEEVTVADGAEEQSEDFSAGEAFETEVASDIVVVQKTEETETQSARAASSVTIDSKTFPDAKFRAYVQNTVDTDKDGKLSASEIKAMTDLDVSGQGISDMTGIEYLTSLTAVNVSKNNLKTLDLSNCGKLEYAVYSNNSLTSVKMPAAKNLTKLDYVDGSNNKFTSQKATGLASISSTDYPSLTQVNFSSNEITSYNCSGFQGMLNISNNKITTLTGGDEGYQAVELNIEGNTLSKTSAVDFTDTWSSVPQRFSCDESVKSKVVMVKASLSSTSVTWDKAVFNLNSTSGKAEYKLERKAGRSGAYKTIKTWAAGEIDDVDFGEDYTNTGLTAGTTYTYRLTTTINVQDKDKKIVKWSDSATVSFVAGIAPTGLTLSSPSKGTVTVSWKAVSGATGYQVYYGTSKTSAKTALTKGTRKLTISKSGLTSKKGYYFRVRAFKKVNGKRVYGPFCTVKGKTVK